MPSLIEHISSSYFEAANKLTSKNSPRKIIAYVESYDDVLFWRNILSQLETADRYFEILLPAYAANGHKRQRLGRGKKSVLQSLLHNTGKDMIACVDADYDYVIQGRSESSKAVLNTPFVFHTYAYAIENLQCYAPGLHNVCVMATLNDRRAFDFNTFLAEYSRIVWPLYVWSVWLYRTGNYDVMSIIDMDRLITFGHFTLEGCEGSLNRMRGRVRSKTKMLENTFKNHLNDIDKLSQELQQKLGVKPEETYLYIHGHHLFERVIVPVLTSVCKLLRREREIEIRRTSLHNTQANNELACYNNSQADITEMLKKSTAYISTPMVRNIVSDISKALS